ncbi:MAG: hypothetical protein Q7K40_00625 [bacterium]|nr:hypothetical protein [bacterium]
MKDDHTSPAPDTIIRDVAIVLGIGLVIYISTNVTTISVDTILSGEAPRDTIRYFLGGVDLTPVYNFFVSLKNPLAVLGTVFLAGSFWATLKIREIHHHEEEKYAPIHAEEVSAKEKFVQWQVILNHVNSESPAEWKLAILEADNILDEILEEEGYVGDTLAEKLKTMSRTKIASYNDIWEAHKVRNEIAHGGAIDMDLSKKLARDTVAKFGNAFKELGYL